MVGVPGRSKACSTCRKRRKGCDGKRPTCGQCKKLGLECAGYIRELVFVNSTRQPSPSREPAVTLPDALARSAYEGRYLELFWSSYLPNGRALSSDAIQDTLGGWTNTIQALYPTNEILRKTILAMAMTSTGKHDGKGSMIEEGVKLYVSALQDMSGALKKPSSANSDAILTTTKLFSLYEAMCGADERDMLKQTNSWLAHSSGELAILAARGPQQFIYGNAHRLFVDGRLHLTISAMRSRKKSVLSEHEWKTIPWSHNKKTLKDELLDILVEMPTLFEMTDLLQSCGDSDKESFYRQNLLDSCRSCDKKLTEWRAKLSPSRELRVLNPGISGTIDVMDVGLAHIMTLYWATSIILSNIMRVAAKSAIRLQDIKYYCRRIIRTVPIFFHPAVGTFRTHLATFPIAVTVRQLGVFEPEERAVEQQLLENCFMKPEGATIGRFLKAWGQMPTTISPHTKGFIN